ncbi:MAG: hypothetical protein JXA09_16885 [Anaerolineae bacterium]|nr:hypothetical protein [Anaerolineae bacterium]
MRAETSNHGLERVRRDDLRLELVREVPDRLERLLVLRFLEEDVLRVLLRLVIAQMFSPSSRIIP